MSRLGRTQWEWAGKVIFLALIVGGYVEYALAPGLLQAQQINAGTTVTAAGQAVGKTDKASLIVTQEYWIGPEDVLDITVWRNADLSKQVLVRPDGRVSLPLIGDITAVFPTAEKQRQN